MNSREGEEERRKKRAHTESTTKKKTQQQQQKSLDVIPQGAGTYWYLPPECFDVSGPNPPRITSKVDVWAAGVMLYQMLFGRRPFGEGRSQEAVLREGLIARDARDPLRFPARPAVSAEAKDFIRACLSYRPEERLDVEEAAAHPYLALRRPERRWGRGWGWERRRSSRGGSSSSSSERLVE